MAYVEMKTKWFSTATPVNAQAAKVELGEGDDGVLTIEYYKVGTEGNEFSVETVIPEEGDEELAVSLVGKTLVISLETDSEGEPDDTANTVEDIAALINELEFFVATASGEGTGAISTEEEEDFEDGQFATKAGTACFIAIGDHWYICHKPVSKWDKAGWFKATLAAV